MRILDTVIAMVVFVLAFLGALSVIAAVREGIARVSPLASLKRKTPDGHSDTLQDAPQTPEHSELNVWLVYSDLGRNGVLVHGLFLQPEIDVGTLQRELSQRHVANYAGYSVSYAVAVLVGQWIEPTQQLDGETFSVPHQVYPVRVNSDEA